MSKLYFSLPFTFYGLYHLTISLYQLYLYRTALLWRDDLYHFLTDYYQVIIFGPAGSGKTLLLSILSNHPLHKYDSYTNFPSFSKNTHDDLIWSDLSVSNRLSPESWIFLDEVGLYGDWTNPKEERKQNEDVALFLQFVRHCRHHLFISTQRLGGGIWNEMRDRSALFIKMTGFKTYSNFTLLTFMISQNERMENPSFWRIPITSDDYKLYDSTWMDPRKRKNLT